MSLRISLSVLFLGACTGSSQVFVQYTPKLSEIGDCVQPSQGTEYVLSGYIRYEQPQFKNTSVYLDLANPNVVQKPARQVLVQIIDSAADRVLALGFSDNNGYYSLRYNKPEASTVKLLVLPRVYANALNPNFRSSDSCGLFLSVLDNTAGGSVYAITSPEITTQTQVYHLTAQHTGSSRPAAVFSVLDSALGAAETILAAKTDITFQPLNLYWSTQNTTASGNLRTGLIGTTFFGQDIFAPVGQGAIYLLGAAGIDTDEFDPNVITHEFGHYLEYIVYRSDTIGGSHGAASRLDLSLAFSEAWGNFFSAAYRQNSLYFDSNGANNASGTNMQLENQPGDNIYNEASVQAALWDIFDGLNDDGVNCGLKPISDAFFSARSLPGFMSYLTFSSALSANNPACLNGMFQSINTSLNAGTISDSFTMTNAPATASGGSCRTSVSQGPLSLPVNDGNTLKQDFSSGGVNNYCAVKWYRISGDDTTRNVNLTGISGTCNLDMDLMEGNTRIGSAGNNGNGGSESLTGIRFKNGSTYTLRIRTVSIVSGTTSCAYTLSVS